MRLSGYDSEYNMCPVITESNRMFEDIQVNIDLKHPKKGFYRKKVFVRVKIASQI